MATPHRPQETLSTNPGDDGVPEDFNHDTESPGIVDTTRRIGQTFEAEQQCQVVEPRSRRGHLEFMTEMPIDTLYEIFRQLDPPDLLYLSWASKSLHYIVMDKSARYIWEEAYDRLYGSKNPPPACPEDINLAQYIRFLYYNKCMLCEIRDGLHACWMMRLRICSHCLEISDQFVVVSDVDLFIFTEHIEWRFVVYAEGKNYVLARDTDNLGEPLQLSEQRERARLKQGETGFYKWEERRFDDCPELTRPKR